MVFGQAASRRLGFAWEKLGLVENGPSEMERSGGRMEARAGM